MATFDELRLQELLKSFNNQSDNTGITSIDQQYTDPKYTYDGLYQDNYEGDDFDSNRMYSTMDPYGYISGTGTRQASVSSAFPFNEFGTESTFAPRVGLPNQVSQINNQNQSTQLFDPTNIQSLIDSAALKNTQPQNFDTSYGVANEADVEQEFLPDQKSSLKDSLSSMGRNFGISSLLGMITGNPIIGLLSRGAKGIGKGLGALNDRMQNSDFGRSGNLADYFDARSYGGIDARNRASQRNMREARAIQKQSDMRGDSTSRISDRDRNSVTRSSAAKSKGVGGGGYTASDSNRESYRG